MRAYDFITSNIGNKVYLIGERDLAINGELRKFIKGINNPNPMQLTIIKLTKGGMAYLKGDDGKYYSVPPKNVREVINSRKIKSDIFLKDLFSSATMILTDANDRKTFYFIPFWFEEIENGYLMHHLENLPKSLIKSIKNIRGI